MNSLDDTIPIEEYRITVKLIAFSVTAVVLVFVAIFFIKTYVVEKQRIVSSIHSEGNVMEAFYSENLNQTWYVINLLSEQIKKDPHNTSYIKDLLKDYMNSADVQEIFGWSEFMWFDHMLHQRVSDSGIVDDNPSPMENRAVAFRHQFPEKMSYRFDDKEQGIYAIVGVIDQTTKAYLGSVVVDFDIATLMRHLDSRAISATTSFALISEELCVVAQSRPNMYDVGLHDSMVVGHHLRNIIKRIFESDKNKAVTFLDMISGVNYHIQKVPDQPLVLLVNMDQESIKNSIFDQVTMKFLETSIVALCLLALIILIYKRETGLRAKSELASEIAKRATKAKSDFLAFTAHEIRSPLGFIMTGSEAMKQRCFGDIDSKYDAYLDGIHQNASLIVDFITDILDETQVLEGTFSVANPEAVDIRDIISRAVSINASRCHSNNVRIDVQIDTNLPMLICDPRRILQVMSNLLSNAIKYSYPNTVVQVVAKMQDENLAIFVIDKGPGMTEAEVNTALTKYGTVRKKDFDFIEAYGLGLPIVKMLLDAHSAKLIIKSEVSVGTEVLVIFPKEKLQLSGNQ